MPPSIVQQFGSMLSARWNLGKEMQSTPSKAPIHETVTYPRIKVTADNNSCLIPSLAYEHILGCGHIIHTATSNEPCAPNCHHVANARAPKKAQPKGVNREGEGKEFYCDACAETEFEALIPEDATATGAENIRRTMREAEAKRRSKATNYRKCYIGLKVTSIPCHSDGSLRSRYVPRKDHHPFDISIPQAGDNFFEDMLVNPPSDTELATDDGATPPGSPIAGDSPANLGEAGANYLSYTNMLAKNGTSKKSPRITFKKPVVKNDKAVTRAGRPAAGRAVVPNAVSSPRTRKRKITDEEYEASDEDELAPPKRRKPTTPKKAVAKKTTANVENTATPVRRRSLRGSVAGKSA